jgi:hypothetical protein
MVRSHDLTYAYSDSYATYERGRAEKDAIRAYAREHLSPETAARVWNEEVDRKVRPGFARSFYWSEPDPV